MSPTGWGMVAKKLRAQMPVNLQYRWGLGLLCMLLLLAGSVSSLYFFYQGSRLALLDLEKEKARSVATRIGQKITDIEQRIAFTYAAKPGESALQRRITEIEMLSQITAITEVVLLDNQGKERLKITGSNPEVLNSEKDHSKSHFFLGVSSGSPWRSEVHFASNAAPSITIAVAAGPQEAGITVAEVNLESVFDGIRRIAGGAKGYAYVVDSKGQLLAHQDPSQVLDRTDLTRLPQVVSAMAEVSGQRPERTQALGVNGQAVLSGYAVIPQLGWLVFAEQPIEEALAPLYSSVIRTGILLLICLGSTVLATLVMLRVRRAAQAVSKHKLEFLAMMSHEMRTPLGGVIGLLGLLMKDDQIHAQARHRVEQARTNAQALLTIISDVLDVAKIEAGKLTLEQVDFDFLELVRETLAAVELKAQEKDLLVVADLLSDLPDYCRADATRIRQILLNLLGNAVKFTDQGGIQLTLSASPVGLDCTMVEFAISDSGPGIPPAVIDRLFKKFEQLDLSSTRRFGGTGLGLAICKELVQLMGGTIDVRSEVGRGSTFTVRLPLMRGKKPKPHDSKSGNRRHSHRLRILCAEDVLTNQVIIRSLLEDLGHEVEIAEDGLQALEALSQRDFDMVLMDGRMPHMDGEEATRRIRMGGTEALKVRSTNINIVALTAHASREDRQKYLAAGMNGFLTKPVDESELFEEIERVISSLLRSAHKLEAMPKPVELTPKRDLLTVAAPGAPSGTQSLDGLFGIKPGSKPNAPRSPRPRAPQRLPGLPGSEPALAARIAAAFVYDAPIRFKAVQEAVQRGDTQAASMEIHALRGAVGYAKLTELQEKLTILEKLADEQDLASVRQGLVEVEALLHRGIASLNGVAQ